MFNIFNWWRQKKLQKLEKQIFALSLEIRDYNVLMERALRA